MSLSFQKMQKNFARAAAEYDCHAQFQQQQMRRVLRHARELMPAHSQLLDIGCGTGLFAHEARDADWSITGVDTTFSMCGVARNRTRWIVNANASALPFAIGSFDAVVSSLCLQWVMDKTLAFNEIYRVLKPGGIALIMTLGSKTLHELRAEAEISDVPITLLSMLSSAVYARVVAQSGLELIGMEDTVAMQEYPSAHGLLRSMRRIGAQSAHAVRPIAPRKMMKMLSNYDKKYASANGVIATWQPVLLHLRKPL